MNTHFLQIVLTSIAAVALSATLTAQQGGTVPASPSRRPLIAEDNGPRPQAFSVALVLGEMQASGGSDNVPAAARKALTDVKDFLPYKAYRLLDSQWTLCCGRPSIVSSPIVSRLRGPDDQDYSVEIVPSSAGNGKYYVHFKLSEPRADEVRELTAPSAGDGAASLLDAQRDVLERQLAELRKTESENHPDVAQTRARIDALERALENSRRPAEVAGQRLRMATARRAVIDTSFTMDVGETVVVGTSRLKGDKALIALLTAVAPTKSAK